MNKAVVNRKLDSLQRCLQRVRYRCPADLQTLANDPDSQDIVVLNLSRAVQLCVDLAVLCLAEIGQPPPQSMGEAFEQLATAGRLEPALATRLRKAVGFRNLAVHNDVPIDWAIVHAIATQHLDDFENFARAVA